MNVKEKIQSVLEALGFTQKFAKNKLTSEEFNSLVVEYQKKYKSTLQDDIAAEDSAKQHGEMQTVNYGLSTHISDGKPC